MKTIIIAAVAANGIIGSTERGLPWHIPEDFKHFKETTLGFPVVMGRTTWLEFRKPLPGRENIVLSFTDEAPVNGFIFFKKMEDALSYTYAKSYEKCFIIGGRMVFEEAIRFVDEMVISHLSFNAEGDISFPHIDTEVWDIVREVPKSNFIIRYYVRRGTTV